VRQRFEQLGDPWAGIDGTGGSLQPLLDLAQRLGPAEKAPKGTGRRQMQMPLIEVTRTKTKDEALADLEVWKAAHPDVAAKLEPLDVLVDGMRGSSSIWYRIRLNLQHVPEPERPAQEPLLHDYNPWAGRSFDQPQPGPAAPEQ
jgi:bifunctional non-homologous end joining protein LigD